MENGVTLAQLGRMMREAAGASFMPVQCAKWRC